MQQDPFAPKYGGPQQPMTPQQFGGMPVGKPQKHGMNMLLIPFILSVVFLLGSLGFGMWAFTQMQDYKNNSDKKSAAAVKIAEQKLSSEKEKEFLEREKKPLKEYKGPAQYGSLSIQYPKTWSAFVTEANSGANHVDGYFHPGHVPGLLSGTDFALRVKVTSKSYADELKTFEGKAKTGKLTISPYRPKKLPEGSVGVRVVGEINAGQQATMVLFPLRDKTIMISTESTQFLNDFDKIIMENINFVP